MEPQLEGSRTEPSRAERSRMEPNTGRSFGVGVRGPSGVELSRVDPSGAEWSRNQGDAVGLGPQPERSRIEPSRAEKSRVEPNSGQCCGGAEPRCKVCKAHVQSTQKPRAKAGPSCKLGPLVSSCKAQEGLVQTAAPPTLQAGSWCKVSKALVQGVQKPSCKRRGRGVNACKGGGGGAVVARRDPRAKRSCKGARAGPRVHGSCARCAQHLCKACKSPPPPNLCLFSPRSGAAAVAIETGRAGRRLKGAAS